MLKRMRMAVSAWGRAWVARDVPSPNERRYPKARFPAWHLSRGETVSSDSAQYLDRHYRHLTDLQSDFRNDNLIQLVASFVKGKSVLDIGSGIGLLLDALQRMGLRAYGLEPNESKDDNAVLQSIRGCLNSDGRLIIVVPAHPFLYGKRDKNAGHVLGDLGLVADQHPDHGGGQGVSYHGCVDDV